MFVHIFEIDPEEILEKLNNGEEYISIEDIKVNIPLGLFLLKKIFGIILKQDELDRIAESHINATKQIYLIEKHLLASLSKNSKQFDILFEYH